MLFNSIHFIYFYITVLVLYFTIPSKYRWFILLASSYYFYMSWNVNYVFLILFTTIISYLTAIQIERSSSVLYKKIYLSISIISSLSVLFFYKYFNFFGSSLNMAFDFVGFPLQVPYFRFLLPVGISFYTFQTLSYSVDVFRGDMKTERHFGIYALYVAFFPQLVAGPIERSTRLLPQFLSKREINIDNFIIGVKWIVLGFFMKLVIADRLGIYVDAVYNNVFQHSGITFIIATVFFAFQIFGDFAGYSSIAIGIARIMGFKLMTNFNRPYFATSIGEFWRRWHISLSTWFRDYFYIPLGGNRVNKSRWYLNLFLTFLVSGLWHGANWTFIIWGGLHGFYLIIEKYFELGVKKNYNLFQKTIRIFIVFILVDFAWIFFRANSISEALYIVENIGIFSSKFFIDHKVFFYGIIGLMILFFNDYFIERSEDSSLLNSRLNIRLSIYFAFLVIVTLSIGVFNGGQFIYFQF